MAKLSTADLLKKLLTTHDPITYGDLSTLLLGLGYEALEPGRRTYGVRLAYINRGSVLKNKDEHIIMFQKPFLESMLQPYQRAYLRNEFKRLDMLVFDQTMGSVFQDNEKQRFYGKLEGTSDLVVYQGKNADEVANAFVQAVKEYEKILETEIEGNKDSGKDTVVSISFSAETYRMIEAVALRKRLSVADLIKEAVEHYSAHEEPVSA